MGSGCECLRTCVACVRVCTAPYQPSLYHQLLLLSLYHCVQLAPYHRWCQLARVQLYIVAQVVVAAGGSACTTAQCKVCARVRETM
jgi:hypothetical protein